MKPALNAARWAAVAAALTLTLASCRAETQNRFRRQILDVANVRMYITVYSMTGQVIFRGPVDGKVTRAAGSTGDGVGGEYVYWFDPSGKYWQTSMPYLVTTDPNRTGETPPATGTTPP